MYHQTYPGYQQIRPPGHNNSTQPLHLQTSPTTMQQQYPPYNYTASPSMVTSRSLQGPPSPSEQSERTSAAEDEFYTLPGPTPTSHLWGGHVWALEVVQHPSRARMCGFGDKDRRPISPPPCVRLIILNPLTKQEIEYDDIELAHLVLAVDIWDLGANRELNLVKQSTASPCISSAATTGYMQKNEKPAHSFERPSTFPLDHHANYQNSAQSDLASMPDQSTPNSYYPQNGQPFPAHRQGYANVSNGNMPAYQNGSLGYSQNQYQYGNSRYQAPQHQQPNQQQGATHENYVSNQQANGQIYTRNLIGSLSASAFKLKDESGKLGIWFVLQDLSVRTEGWFRLKLNFFNLSQSVESQLKTVTTNGGNGNDVNKQAHSTAPCLASAFSNPFKVFSAKKFPGVVESTPLSRAFAGQGIKIPIRKDTQGGAISKRGRDGSDDDDNNSDMEG